MTITLTNKVVTEVQRTIEHHELVMELRADILAYGPEHFDMKTWWDFKGMGENDEFGGLEGIVKSTADKINRCGTTGCLAGHATAYAVRNGIVDLIADGSIDSDYYRVPSGSVAHLLGVASDAFGSSYNDWHPVAQVAFLNDVTIMLQDQPVSYGYNQFTDYHEAVDITVAVDVTVECHTWQDLEHMLYNRPTYIAHDGNTGDTADDVYAYYRRHAEWVAITTYLLYLARASESLHWGNVSSYLSRGEREAIINSPAYSPAIDGSNSDDDGGY